MHGTCSTWRDIGHRLWKTTSWVESTKRKVCFGEKERSEKEHTHENKCYTTSIYLHIRIGLERPNRWCTDVGCAGKQQPGETILRLHHQLAILSNACLCDARKRRILGWLVGWLRASWTSVWVYQSICLITSNNEWRWLLKALLKIVITCDNCLRGFLETSDSYANLATSSKDAIRWRPSHVESRMP